MASRVRGMEENTSAIPVDLPEPAHLRVPERVQELEMENARLKSLVGELLVANQLLREKCREQSSGPHG